MTVSTLREAAASLVSRARNGDQNAMGMLAQIRVNATKGVPRAIAAQDMVLGFIRANPVGRVSAKAAKPIPETSIGAESAGALQELSAKVERGYALPDCFDCLLLLANESQVALLAGCVILSHGPDIRNQDIRVMVEALPPYAGDLLHATIASCCKRRKRPLVKSVPAAAVPIVYAGQCIGMAQGLQRLRRGAPIGQLYPRTAHELGE